MLIRLQQILYKRQSYGSDSAIYHLRKMNVNGMIKIDGRYSYPPDHFANTINGNFDN